MASEFSSDIVGEDDTYKLLTHFVKTSHRIKNPDIRGETVMEMCCLLFQRDYKFMTVPNMQGELCSHYPMKLVVLEYEREEPADDKEVESQYDPIQLEQMIRFARCSRCRSRFVMPVILFEGKHVCRSATLSGAAEMFGRSTKDYILSRRFHNSLEKIKNSLPHHFFYIRSDMFSTFRGHDIDLLKFFDVHYICDLMVEKKKTKFKMAITSSEKVDKENRYSDFTILQMPYPGCELFKDWKANMYNGHVTAYDWALAMNDSDLDLPKSPIVEDVQVEWQAYRVNPSKAYTD
ncbi:myotubularin-related protein 14 [Elysia marginata]|uniref:Myotubularin-related protein 14 n=1 Tax=Elysia marginata TaxID=1093978 RepID=A0AAV4I7Y3_9GAST|nr:myotubularin-related protein 14 [Elysia marginata]